MTTLATPPPPPPPATPPASPPHLTTTTTSAPLSSSPRLVSPNPEINLVSVSAADKIFGGGGDDSERQQEKLQPSAVNEKQAEPEPEEENLDAYDYDIDFGEQEEAPSGSMFTFAPSEVFPMETLSKMSTFSELVESLVPEQQPKKAEDVISDALSQMTLSDREKIIRDLYGIEKIQATTSTTTSHLINNSKDYPVTTTTTTTTTTEDHLDDDENLQFLETKLMEMDQAIERMKKAYGWNIKMVALEMAEQQNLQYTCNPKFRLQFLRVDRFDVNKAASRFIRYFDWKLELFGEHTLTRNIVWSDLPAQDQAMLKRGYMQRLPVRDRAGRSIFVVFYMGQVYESPQSKARQLFYMLSSTDEETDRKGQIALFFKLKDIRFQKTTGFGGLLYMFRFFPEFPVRFDAFHKFKESQPNAMSKILDFCMSLMNPEYQARTRVHFGNYNDWVTSLMSFGIPHDVIPFTQSYKIKTKNHQEYLSMRMKAEDILATNNMTSDQLIDLPTRRDVLLGKGRPIQFSSGNQALSMIVEGYLDRYHNQCNKVEKTALANEILRMVQSNGVRFLSKEPHGIWIEVSHEVARDKLSHMFRHQKKKCNTSGNNKTATTATIRRGAPEAEATLGQEGQEQAKRIKL